MTEEKKTPAAVYTLLAGPAEGKVKVIATGSKPEMAKAEKELLVSYAKAKVSVFTAIVQK